MRLDLIEFAQALTRIVNTRFHRGGGTGHENGAHHAGASLYGMRFPARCGEIGRAHGDQALARVVQENRIDLFNAGRLDGPEQTVEDLGVDHSIAVRGNCIRLGNNYRAGEGGLKALRGERLFEDSVVSIQMRRGRGAHSKEPGTGRDFPKRMGQFGRAETGHAQVGQHAVRHVGGGHLQSGFPTLRLENGAALGFQQQRGDREADGIVVHGKDAAGEGFHDGTIVHSERPGITGNARVLAA